MMAVKHDCDVKKLQTPVARCREMQAESKREE